MWINDIHAQEYRGDVTSIDQQVFNNNSLAKIDCDFIDLYRVNSYLRTVQINDQSFHVIDHAFISGCDVYSIVWNAPSLLTGLAISNDDVIYLSTLSNGIYVYKNERIQKLFISNVDLPLNVFNILIIGHELIVSSDQGIHSLNLSNHLKAEVYAMDSASLQVQVDQFSRLWIKEGENIILDDSRFNPLELEIELYSLDEDERLDSFLFLNSEDFVGRIANNLFGNVDEVSYSHKVNGKKMGRFSISIYIH